MTDDRIENWVNQSKKKENEWPAVVGVLGTLVIIAATIILLVKL